MILVPKGNVSKIKLKQSRSIVVQLIGWQQCQRHATHMPFERSPSTSLSVQRTAWHRGHVKGGPPRAAHAGKAATKESDRALRRSGAAAVPGQSSPEGHGRSGWWPEQTQAWTTAPGGAAHQAHREQRRATSADQVRVLTRA